jgi:hypothetical protein
MNRSNIRFNVASNLGDSGMIAHSADSINESIQEAYEYLCVKTLCLEKSFKFPQLDNQVYYDFLSFYPDFLAVSAIWSFNINRWLIPASRKLFDTWRWDWELMTGEPRWFDPINYRYTAIMPHNPTAAGGFQVFYKSKAAQLDDISAIYVPPSAIKAIENYATADQFFIDREFTKGFRYLMQFLTDIPIIKKLSLQKAEADRINLCAPNDSMPIFSGQGDDVWITNETVQGTIDGTNNVFTLAKVPNPTSSLILLLNGLSQIQGINYDLSNNTITFRVGSVPQVNSPVDNLRAWYEI